MRNSGWSRRTALVHLARAGVLLARTAPGPQNAPSPPVPRPAHPRLILPDSDLPRLQALVRDYAPARKLWAELRREGEKLLNAPPLQSRAFPRMPGDSRRIMERIYLFGLLYRLEHETAYLTRAVRELTAAAESREANPSRLLETAEWMHALAVGYDWFWPELKTDERDLLREALVTRGLKNALPLFEKQSSWFAAPGAANVAANAGVGMAAIAVAGDEPELSAAILKHALDSMARSFAGPDGGWIEGPGALSFATRYAALFLASLETAGALADPLVLRGLERAARYRVYSRGPLGRAFALPGTDAAPEMFWLARRVHQPALAWSEQRELSRRPNLEALDVIWLVRDAAPPQPPAWPLDALFATQQRAFLRSSWDDPESIFVALRGGEPKGAHSRSEPGTFALDALGVRWTLDSDNPLLIDGAGPDLAAEIRIAGHEFTPGLAWVALDLTRAYASKVTLWQRRVGLAQRQAVMIEDRVRANEPVDASWSLLTDAEISFGGQSALLNKGGALLAAEIQTPRHAVFDVVQVAPNRRRLVAAFGGKTADVDLNILLTPYRAGQPKPKIAARFPD